MKQNELKWVFFISFYLYAVRQLRQFLEETGSHFGFWYGKVLPFKNEKKNRESLV